MINKFRVLIFLLLIPLPLLVFGQESDKYKGKYANFYRGEELFEKEQFSAAREVFDEFVKTFSDVQDPQYVKALYYRGISALELYNDDAVELLVGFDQSYPENIYKNNIYLKIGEYYYQRNGFKETKYWLDKVDPRKIDESYIAAYHFKLGLSNFKLENYEEARNEFYEIKDGTSNYSPPALYYYSYIAYKNGTYQEALTGFLKLEETASFKKEAPNYITQIYYLMGNYEGVIQYAEKHPLDASTLSKNTPEMNQIIGDAYYRTKSYLRAVPYLEDYSQRKQTTRDDDYILGYTYLKTKNYKRAIQLFGIVSRTPDKLGQAAFYHIAQAYMEQDNLSYARTAFKSASDLNFDSIIEEDALYNFAVLSYKLDNDPYGEAIVAFEHFLKKYPHSDRLEDVYDYLVNVYSSTKNYKEALASLSRVPDMNAKMKMAYQIASYNYGVEKYERGDYEGSIQQLRNVSKYDMNPSISAKAKYWEGDAQYMLLKWTQAIQAYRAFLYMPGMTDLSLKEAAYYNISYAYYNQKDWVQAIQTFRTYTQLSNIQDKSKLADAYARLGDCYYTKDNPDFQNAASNYERALNYSQSEKDKVLFALARVYKLMPGKRGDQIATLNRLLAEFPNSPYEVVAIFDLGKSYKNNSEYVKAMNNFDRILNNYATNLIVKDVLLEVADMKFKQGLYEESESFFRRVLNEFSVDNETCKQAVTGILDIYRVTRQQEKIIELSRQYACAGISEDDQETIFYDAASELYSNERYSEAIPEINKYLSRYPDGRYAPQLLSYLGDIYYQQADTIRSLQNYERLIAMSNTAYTENALVRATKMLYKKKEYEKAQPYYQKLEKLTSDPDILLNSRVGIMRTSFLLKKYSEASIAAEKVLSDNLLRDQQVRIEGNYVAGMSFYSLKNYSKSLSYLKWTADNTGNEWGDESLYSLQSAYYFLEDYTNAEVIHEEMLSRKPKPKDYWIGKSLLLQAGVFMAKGDLFQANQTVDIVLNNYPFDDDGIKTEADELKSDIIQMQSNPRSIKEEVDRTIDVDEENDNYEND